MRKLFTGSRGILLAAAILFLLPSLTPAQISNIQPRITAAIDDSTRVTIPHSTHPLALPAFDTGRLDGSTSLERMILVLGVPTDQDHQLRTFLDSQQTQGSPDYHRWLTPDEFGQQFGPAPQDIQTVSAWLRQQGFTVGEVARGGRWIEFSGTSAQVESAFQTQMHTYQVNGEAHVANSSDISIPAALAPVVRGIASLHNFFKQPLHIQGPLVQRMADGTYAPANSDSTLSNGTHGLAPADFAKIYDVPNSLLSPAPAIVLNGTGETIAIVARSDINTQDVADFHTVFGLPAVAPTFILNGTDPGIASSDDQVETTLDTEWSGAVAPGATIDVVISGSTLIVDGVDLSAAYIVDQNLAPIMSVSFGTCEANLGGAGSGENIFLEALWQQAAAQGISVFIASGDTGAAGCDPNAPAPEPGAQEGVGVSGVASTPFDTAVGGLEFNETGAGENPPPNPPTTNATFWSATNGTNRESALGYIPEMVWNDSCNTGCEEGEDSLEAGGGGVSLLYATPSYQTLGVAGLATTLNAFTLPGSTLHPRGVPDVSLTASPNHDSYLICLNTSCEPTSSPKVLLVGGTSASAPAFAGIMAVVDQKIGEPQGLANYVLYPLAAAATYSGCNSNSRTNPATPTTCVFNDVTLGNNGVPGNDVTNDPATGATGYPAGTGYDLASGLGSVDVNNLVNAWSTKAALFEGSLTTISPSTAINITHGQSVTLTVDVAKMPSGSGPTGNVSLIAQGGNLPNTVGVAASALSGGSASVTFNGLPGGTGYNLIANYPGDGTFAGSMSNAVPVTVAKEASAVKIIDATPNSTELTNSALSIPYGTPLAFEALISGQSSINDPTGDGAATGTVTFTATLGSTTTNLSTALPLVDFAQLSVGNAEFYDCSGTQNCLAPGTNTVNASYSGDNSFLAGNSSPNFSLTVTVTSAATAISASSPAAGTTIQQGASVTLNATVTTTSSGAAPNGTVTFFSGSTQLGNPVTVTGTPGSQTFFGAGAFAGATASLTTTSLPIGTDNITAKYNGDSGDTDYAASPASAGITITVTGPTFTVAASPTTIPVSAPGGVGSTVLTFTAQNGFSSGGAVTVTPVCSGLPSETTCSIGGQVTIPMNGTAMATVTFLTTAPSAAIPTSRNRPNIPGWRTITTTMVLACLLWMSLLLRGLGRKQRRRSFALVLTAFVLFAVSVGCGGSGNTGPQNPGTPPGQYSISVMVTINGVTQSIPNLTLNVQ
ncbi:MAG: Ig-like domain repeat protein [Candidatus Acidiferrales bacterium]|jgi:subtilase family serine protease